MDTRRGNAPRKSMEGQLEGVTSLIDATGVNTYKGNRRRREFRHRADSWPLSCPSTRTHHLATRWTGRKPMSAGWARNCNGRYRGSIRRRVYPWSRNTQTAPGTGSRSSIFAACRVGRFTRSSSETSSSSCCSVRCFKWAIYFIFIRFSVH